MATLKNTVFNDIGSITLPVGNTAQRPASPTDGMLRFNTTLGYIEWISRIKSNYIEIDKRNTMSKKALKKLGVLDIINFGFPDNQLDTIPLLVITKKLENVINQYKPQIIYTHHIGDLNIDHEITHKAVLTACRPQPNFSVLEIYSFEIMSSTEWGTPGYNTFVPDTFIDITKFINKKMAALNFYKIEMRDSPHSRSLEHIKALSVHRGNSVGLIACESFKTIRRIIK